MLNSIFEYIEDVLKIEMCDPYVAIIAPFKTATTSLNTALFSAGVRTFKYHGFDDELCKIYPPEGFSHVFLLIRDPLSTYVSAYFQDIDVEGYVYYFGSQERVLETSVDELLEHFRSFMWSEFSHVNHEYFYECIEKYFEVKLKRLDVEESFCVFKKKDRYFVVVRTEELDANIDGICNVTGLPKLTLERHNNSKDKWYFEKYEMMKERLGMNS
jgi:hypothetical protein